MATASELDYATQAELLNTQFDAEGLRFDSLYNSLDKERQDLLRESFSQWQDWYYGNWDNWGPTVERWQLVLDNITAVLNAAEAKGAVAEAVPEYSERVIEIDNPTYYTPEPNVIEMEPIYIYGTVPKEPEIYDPEAEALNYEVPDFEIIELEQPKIHWGWVVGGLLGGYFIYKASKGRR